MNFSSLLGKRLEYGSVIWHESRCCKPVRFAVRRPSLGQRIELTGRVRDLTMQHEFLRSGDVSDQLSASLADLLVDKLYLEWGLAEVTGLALDGQPANIVSLIEKGPEQLVNEIVDAIKRESGLTDDERKNC